MHIRDWMKRPVRAVKPLDTIAHARAILEEHRINQLPVLAGNRLVGIITDRDLRDAFPSVFDAPALADETGHRPARTPEEVRVDEVMTRNVFTLAPGEVLAEAARLMRRERVGGIPIVEGEHLVGIITRCDVLDAFVVLAGGGPTAEPSETAQRQGKRQRRR